MQRHAIELQVQALEAFARKLKNNGYSADSGDFMKMSAMKDNLLKTLAQQSGSIRFQQQQNRQSGFDGQRAAQSANDKLAVIERFKKRLQPVLTTLLVALAYNKIDFQGQSKARLTGELFSQAADHVEQLKTASESVEKILQHHSRTETSSIMLEPAIRQDVKMMENKTDVMGAIVITLQLFAMWAYEKSRQGH